MEIPQSDERKCQVWGRVAKSRTVYTRCRQALTCPAARRSHKAPHRARCARSLAILSQRQAHYGLGKSTIPWTPATDHAGDSLCGPFSFAALLDKRVALTN